MTARSTIRFVLDDRLVEVRDADPTMTVLQYLREALRRKGTKEGCAEGDCGACTVVVADQHGDDVELRAINSCIQFLPTLDGKQLFTVESLQQGQMLHPVQQAMVAEHGSQCGFCTPGIVMSLFALYEQGGRPDRQTVDDALSGNLCRCTGYRPIIAAAQQMHDLPGNSPPVDRNQLSELRQDSPLAIEYCGKKFFAPQSVDELARLYSAHPDATLLAGGTDVGLWVTKRHRHLDTVIYTGRVDELQQVTTGACLEIGAAVALTDAVPPIVALYPGLNELFRRFASPPIRNAGTLGGNIANGSPIGDSMAALMVIGCTLVLRCANREREVTLEDFYHDYMVNDLQPGEFVARIRIALPVDGDRVASHKWSKRFDQDISAVCTAYRLRIDDGIVGEFRMACGGMAATVRRAVQVEKAVTGQPWNESTLAVAVDALQQDFAPISDMRASAPMRMRACQNLLQRFYHESQAQALPTVYAYGR